MKDDRELLARYISEVSEDAFAELVRRHMGLVYSAALRQVRDPQSAQDVTQLVFANLARKARSIPRGVVLAGWLHRDTRFTALDFLRAEARRSRREQEAAAMNALESESSPDWEQIRPLLDEALDQLPPADRDALLLRFFEQRDFAGVGEALGASAEAARKRVDRALDRLRERLVKRGISTSGVALGGALTAHAVESVPAGFAATLVAGSTATAAAVVASGFSGWISNVLLMTKTKIAVTSALIAAGVATPFFFQQQALGKARAEQVTLQEQTRSLAGRIASARLPVAAHEVNLEAQRDRDDLQRLRREAADLRAQLSLLAAEEKNLAAARDARKSGEAARRVVVGLADARDVGQSTPADLLQTCLWALSNGDTNRLLQLMTGDADTDVEKVLPQAFAMLREGLVNTVSSYGCTGFQIQGDEPAENTDRWLQLDPMTTNGVLGEPGQLRIRPIGAGWKLVVTTNGMPATRGSPQR